MNKFDVIKMFETHPTTSIGVYSKRGCGKTVLCNDLINKYKTVNPEADVKCCELILGVIDYPVEYQNTHLFRRDAPKKKLFVIEHPRLRFGNNFIFDQQLALSYKLGNHNISRLTVDYFPCEEGYETPQYMFIVLGKCDEFNEYFFNKSSKKVYEHLKKIVSRDQLVSYIEFCTIFENLGPYEFLVIGPGGIEGTYRAELD
uniref:Uncharacterized protein n=1 Tax=viral metagenome TaxID=1070528 RepID=A0A6C0CLG8_9ZZZZ